ncbi:GNAT family N-acetyltransferase [Kribbella albertanoniae]|uniref:GNAT family N-acetyltransferase n=1 Tax=Kribbella albertanoniae TaxID=1266829 RepID=A0A4R4Q7J2_9ACTN|nr:GNAT family N-acetyltransferase [Kribbella albertanoniae]
MRIRPASGDDAEAVAALRRAVYEYKVMSPAAARHMMTVFSPAERFLALVAEADGELVAWGSAGLNTWTSEAGRSNISLYVHPEHRKQGIGSTLIDRLHQHLTEVGATRVGVFVRPEGLEFARKRGYDGTRQMHFAGAGTADLPEQPPTPADIELVTMDQVDPRQAFAADAAASLDEPSDAPMDAVDYDDWFNETWTAPALDKSLSVAAVAGDEVVCFTAVETASDRAWSGMTGTIPAYRGRGLAKLVKSVALRRCAAAGITSAYTSNDDVNGPMLAINNWLGYRRVATEYGLMRTL